MKRQMTQIVSTLIVVLFVFSTLPFVSNTNSTAELRDAIHMVQLLQKPDNPSHLSFKSIFKNTIISLQSAADFNTVYTQQQDEKQDEAQLNISIRSPYLLTKSIEVAVPLKEVRSASIEQQQLYLSHITSPPLPPPICS